jgi:hypothetical protein
MFNKHCRPRENDVLFELQVLKKHNIPDNIIKRMCSLVHTVYKIAH